ncbi:AraC family transcriptional regulator [uncultured Croceitalea sp.]|uniref:AraC family transcriptional regulator n=1 Tax=uncultured Croceitalea sp. TaxID=1798908 RepID=UPI003305A9F6
MNIDENNKTWYKQLPILDGLELLNAKSHTLDFPFHTHDTFNITLILDNTFNTKLQNKLLRAPKGSLSITNPKEVHATPCDKELGNSFFTFYISPDVVKYLNKCKDAYFEDRIIYDSNLFIEFYYLSQLKKEQLIISENRLLSILKILVNKYATTKLRNLNKTLLFQSFINETNFDSFSLDTTAAKFGINKYKFLRIFKQETGLTPYNYVLLKKIELSKEMLKKDIPILYVAIDSGFYDISHFYKTFKKFTGVNPLDFKAAFYVN